jgi:tetratricopeptide (TPR) repeat protein
VEAGEPAEALEPLMEAYGEWRRLGEFERGLEVLTRRGELLEEAGVDADDPRMIENIIESSRCRMTLEPDRTEAVAALRDSRRRAEGIGGDRLLAKALVAEAWECRMRAEFDRAEACCERGAEAARRAGDADELSLALINLGWARLSQNRLSASEDAFNQAREVAKPESLTMRRVMSRRGLATVALAAGHSEAALELLEPALAESRDKGLRLAELQCLNAVGEAGRLQGNNERAKQAYWRCLELARELNQVGYETNCWINLAQVDLAEERYEDAREGLEKARRGLEEESRLESRKHILQLAEAAWAAGVGRWERFDELLAYYEEGFSADDRMIRDYPWLLELAGASADNRDQRGRAEAAWELARDLWKGLGNDAAVERVEVLLEE